MSEELTRKQKQMYLKKGGVACPFCESEDIEGGFVEIDEGYVTQGMNCVSCGRRWNDVYKLKAVDVEPVG